MATPSVSATGSRLRPIKHLRENLKVVIIRPLVVNLSLIKCGLFADENCPGFNAPLSIRHFERVTSAFCVAKAYNAMISTVLSIARAPSGACGGRLLRGLNRVEIAAFPVQLIRLRFLTHLCDASLDHRIPDRLIVPPREAAKIERPHRLGSVSLCAPFRIASEYRASSDRACKVSKSSAEIF